ncbi:MAG: ABC transporter substrate-binding protein, partial [Bacillota bacterium]
MIKNIKLIVIMSLIIGLLLTSNLMAQGDLIDPDIPESWYENLQTASELDIEEFDQSPVLDDKVEKGELPPVEERLPDDPPVIEPYDEVGEYGGTLNLWDNQLEGYEMGYFNYSSGGYASGGAPAIKSTPDGQIFPYFVKDWEFSNDYKDLTIFLREGIKFSDGEPLNADDIMYWWEHHANVEELEPVPPEEWKPPLIDVTKEDDHSVTLHYGKSAPNVLIGLNVAGPEHYMKEFHPDFVDKDQITEMAQEV